MIMKPEFKIKLNSLLLLAGGVYMLQATAAEEAHFSVSRSCQHHLQGLQPAASMPYSAPLLLRGELHLLMKGYALQYHTRPQQLPCQFLLSRPKNEVHKQWKERVKGVEFIQLRRKRQNSHRARREPIVGCCLGASLGVHIALGSTLFVQIYVN